MYSMIIKRLDTGAEGCINDMITIDHVEDFIRAYREVLAPVELEFRIYGPGIDDCIIK